MKRTFEVVCGCCKNNGTVTFEDKEWISSTCEGGCTFLSMPHEMYNDFCRQIDENKSYAEISPPKLDMENVQRILKENT